MTDEQILATWNNFTDYSGHCRNIFAFARALLAASTPNNGNVAAWMTEDGRVISAEQKAGAERDGGASASSVQPYRIALVVEAASDKQEAISNEAAMQWVERHNLDSVIRNHESARCAIDDARSLHMLDAAPRPAAQDDAVKALQSARHAVYSASTLDDAFNSVQKLIDAAIAKEKQG
ncbi:hypothetical protein BSFA1_10490 [Burkholderia sp. SFA1]|nr:hypothetical protein BSFA1_10490 [Burkholderia sp. SFA1]